MKSLDRYALQLGDLIHRHLDDILFLGLNNEAIATFMKFVTSIIARGFVIRILAHDQLSATENHFQRIYAVGDFITDMPILADFDLFGSHRVKMKVGNTRLVKAIYASIIAQTNCTLFKNETYKKTFFRSI